MILKKGADHICYGRLAEPPWSCNADVFLRRPDKGDDFRKNPAFVYEIHPIHHFLILKISIFVIQIIPNCPRVAKSVSPRANLLPILLQRRCSV